MLLPHSKTALLLFRKDRFHSSEVVVLRPRMELKVFSMRFKDFDTAVAAAAAAERPKPPKKPAGPSEEEKRAAEAA